MTALDVPRHTYVGDTILWPGIDALANCLCQELIRSALPATCFCGVVAGEVALDLTDDDTGMAWVRLVQAYPSTTFPQPATGNTTCMAPLAAELEIGVVHCFPAAKAGEPPTPSEQWEAAQLQQADMMAMYRAVQCCYAKFEDVALGIYAPLGPDGGLVGGTWQVWIGGWKGR